MCVMSLLFMQKMRIIETYAIKVNDTVCTVLIFVSNAIEAILKLRNVPFSKPLVSSDKFLESLAMVIRKRELNNGR